MHITRGNIFITVASTVICEVKFRAHSSKTLFESFDCRVTKGNKYNWLCFSLIQKHRHNVLHVQTRNLWRILRIQSGIAAYSNYFIQVDMRKGALYSTVNILD